MQGKKPTNHQDENPNCIKSVINFKKQLDSLFSYAYVRININEGTDIYLPFTDLSHSPSSLLKKDINIFSYLFCIYIPLCIH